MVRLLRSLTRLMLISVLLRMLALLLFELAVLYRLRSRRRLLACRRLFRYSIACRNFLLRLFLTRTWYLRFSRFAAFIRLSRRSSCSLICICWNRKLRLHGLVFMVSLMILIRRMLPCLSRDRRIILIIILTLLRLPVRLRNLLLILRSFLTRLRTSLV